MNEMTRPVGRKILQICEILQRIGNGGAGAIRTLAPGINDRYLRCYIKRARTMGLIITTESRHTRNDFNIYSLADNWISIVDSKKGKPRPEKQPKIIQAPIEKVTRWTGVNSVFGMGAK